MNDDFAIEWENIEYALNESELITLSEFTSKPVYAGPGVMGQAVMAPLYAGYEVGAGAVKMVGDSLKGYNPLKASLNNSAFGLNRTIRAVARSPLCKIPFWDRLVAKIKEIWQKFKNVMSAIFRTNKGFVEKELYNAEAIINNALAQDVADNDKINLDLTFKDVKPYWNGERYFNQIKLPPLNINDQRMMGTLSDVNQFVATYLRGLTNLDFNNGDCVTKLNYYLSGGDPINVNLYDLVPYIKNLISYCRDADDIIRQLEEEQQNLEKAAQDAINMLQRSGVMQEMNNPGMQQQNIQQPDNSGIVDAVTKIRNYISCVSRISGVKKTVVRDRYNQSVNILREVLKKCRPATKHQIENTEIKNKTKVIEEPKNGILPEKTDKKAKKGWFTRKTDDNYEDNEKATAKKGVLEITDKNLLNSLPNNTNKLKKRAKQVAAERDEIVNFIKNKKIAENDPRFKPLWDQAQDYNKHLAVIEKKLNDLNK